jgi:hypothetical protein
MKAGAAQGCYLAHHLQLFHTTVNLNLFFPRRFPWLRRNLRRRDLEPSVFANRSKNVRWIRYIPPAAGGPWNSWLAGFCKLFLDFDAAPTATWNISTPGQNLNQFAITRNLEFESAHVEWHEWITRGAKEKLRALLTAR